MKEGMKENEGMKETKENDFHQKYFKQKLYDLKEDT